VLKRLLVAAVVLAAFPATADVRKSSQPRLQRPRPATGAWSQGTAPPPSGGSAPVCFSVLGGLTPCVLDVEYFGGPVLSNVKVYAVFWSSGVSAEIADGMGDFYRTLTNSEWMDWLTEYSTTLDADAGTHRGEPGTQQTIGRGTFAGSRTLGKLSKAYPNCLDAPALTCLQDTDIQAELDWQIAQGRLPVPDANTLYMVHFPSTVRVVLGIDDSCMDFCAYHNAYASTDENRVGQWVYYAVLPDLGSNGCETQCGSGTTFQSTCSAASHELAESVTDSNVAGPLVNYPLAWYDVGSENQGEIADICEPQDDAVAENGLTGCDASDAGCYTLQKLFSRRLWNAEPAEQPNVAACVARRFDVDDYSIALTPNTLFLRPGAPASVPILTLLTSGNAQPLTLSISGLSPGLHASLDTTSLNVGELANLVISADAETMGVDGVVVVLATGTTSHSAALLVQANDWSLSLSPAEGFVGPGTSQVYTVAGQVTSGDAEPVTLSPTVSGLPAGVTASFNTLMLTPGASTALLTLSASEDVQPDAGVVFAVTAESVSRVGSAIATLQVDALPRVVITRPGPGATVNGVTTVQVTATAAPTSTVARVAVAVDGNPPFAQGTSSTVDWDTRGLSNGTHALQATAVDADGVSNSTSVDVTVTNAFDSFTLTVTPGSVALPPGGSATLLLATAALGVPETITLSVTGLPKGVDASFPSEVLAGETATLTLLAPSGTAPASSTGRVLGTSPRVTPSLPPSR
jgi:Bacterial Ig domain